MKTKRLFFALFYFVTLSILAQNSSDIEKEVILNNKRGKFDKSIEVILHYLNNGDVTPYEKYKAYILKSYTHKALFDYDKTFESLDLALKEGVKSDKKEEVIANVKAEKAFAYFDIQNYKESAVLINELKQTNYKYLDLGNTSYLIMQDGYIDFLNGNYLSAEKKYDEALSFMTKSNTDNLAPIYGKKILLYSKLKNVNKALKTFNEAINAVNKIKGSKKLKYKLYLNESLKTFYAENNQWKLAYKTFENYDSLTKVYQAEENARNINLLEKDFEIEKKNHEIKTATIFRNSLLAFCAVLIFGIYLSIKLYKSNKEKSVLLEKENIRIHDELQILTNSLNSQGFTNIDLSKFNFSERQLEIIELIRKGKSNKEIANQIFISENTVKYHLKAIYDILNIENRSEFFKLISK